MPFTTPSDLLDPETEPASLVSPTLTGGFFTISATWEAHFTVVNIYGVRELAGLGWGVHGIGCYGTPSVLKMTLIQGSTCDLGVHVYMCA